MISALQLLFNLSLIFGTPDQSSVLIVSGQNNHDWVRTVEHIERILLDANIFSVNISLTPEKEADQKAWDDWNPEFDAYDVILLVYNGELWPERIRTHFEAYVSGGGHVLVQHAANNPFPGWEAYEEMVGLLWRNADAGYGAYWDEKDGLMRISPGEDQGAGHGPLHDWTITTRDLEHPIMTGIPKSWLHPHDELYHGQRGPAQGLNVLATAWSDLEFGGTGRHELMIWWTQFGEGKILTFLPGHLWGDQEDDRALRCVGFQTLLQRSAEWLATNAVTIPVPENFPTAEQIKVTGE
ncbi:MAG: ThuA domain-containing protein [Bacteroidetes bacterium]|nr:ThuA domain-containing protein [Bacteroidota bacterium]MCY4204692.1 ThuA domain-containing protein [Bacteroidota bacterium]